MGTCIIDWILEARNKIWKSDPQNPDSYGNRPISEHTLVQPCASSSDIEWGTPIPPPHSNICIYVLYIFTSLVHWTLTGRARS